MVRASAVVLFTALSLTGTASVAEDTRYLDPVNGRDCVQVVGEKRTDLSSSYSRKIEYRATFTNTCGRTFRIVGRIVPASTYSGGDYYLTRTTGIDGNGKADLVCQDDGSASACVGWSGYRIE